MGKIQRDQAIELLKNHSLSDLERRQDIEFVASKLGYSVEQLTSIMSSLLLGMLILKTENHCLVWPMMFIDHSI